MFCPQNSGLFKSALYFQAAGSIVILANWGGSTIADVGTGDVGFAVFKGESLGETLLPRLRQPSRA